MGEQAAHLLIDRLQLDYDDQDDEVIDFERDMNFRTVVVETELIERESTK